MNKLQVAIFGGTGQTGRAVTQALRARGADAVSLSRGDVAKGPSAVVDADIAYLISPNMHHDEPSLIQHFLDLLREAGVPRVVYHSVAAPYVPAMRHHVGKAVSEDLVRRSGLRWTILQPAVYIQNFLPAPGAEEIRVPFRVDAPFGLVDLADLGEAAANVCVDNTHHGATYELGGPATVTIADYARIVSDVLGRDVTAVAESTQQWADRNRGQMSPQTLEMFTDMWNYYDAYGLLTGAGPLRALLGRTATSVGEVLTRSTR